MSRVYGRLVYDSNLRLTPSFDRASIDVHSSGGSTRAAKQDEGPMSNIDSAVARSCALLRVTGKAVLMKAVDTWAFCIISIAH